MGPVEIAALIAALITVVAAVIYTLGLIALVGSIHARITQDVSLAWHAVSLMPKTAVAGLGVRTFLGFPLFLGVSLIPLAGAFAALQGMLASISSFITFPIGGVLALNIVLFVILAYLLIKVWNRLFGNLSRHFIWLFEPEAVHSTSRFVKTAAQVVGIAMLCIASWWFALLWSNLFITGQLQWNTIFQAGLLSFCGAFVLQLPDALAIDAPLLTVKITRSDKTEEVLDGGRLVAHSDGVWYFFDIRGKLAAIPDEKVSAVEVLKSDYQNPWIDDGFEQQELGRYKQALENAEKALELEPSNPHALNLKAGTLELQAKLDQAKLEEAIKLYRRAIKFGPKNAYIYRNLGDALLKQGKVNEAAKIYQQSKDIEPNPDYALAWVGIARIALWSKNDSAFPHAIKRARALVDSDTDTYNAACIESLAGETEEALRLLENAMEKGNVDTEWAKQDLDLSGIRDDPRFWQIIGEPEPQAKISRSTERQHNEANTVQHGGQTSPGTSSDPTPN